MKTKYKLWWLKYYWKYIVNELKTHLYKNKITPLPSNVNENYTDYNRPQTSRDEPHLREKYFIKNTLIKNNDIGKPNIN